jgi:hypothetical protein
VVPWTIEVTPAFEEWWGELSQEEQVSIDGMMRVLEVHGPNLGPPFSGHIAGSRYPQLRNLRIPHDHDILCVLCTCDEWRETLVLLTAAKGPAAAPCTTEGHEHADAVYESYLAFMNRGAH